MEIDENEVDYSFVPSADTITLGTEVELTINSVADNLIEGKLFHCMTHTV